MIKEEIKNEAQKLANDDAKHSHIKLDYQDGIYYGFIEGASYVLKQLNISDVSNSVCPTPNQ